jgi:AraC family transcriptional regulator
MLRGTAAREASRAEAPRPDDGTVWRLPGRREISWHRQARFEIGVYERGAGEGVWRGARHRLVFSLDPRPPILLQLDGGRPVELPAAPDPIGFYPAGATARTVGESSRYAQVCWDPDLYQLVAPEMPRTPGLEPGIGQDPLIGQLARSLAEATGQDALDRLLAETLVTAIALRTAQLFGGVRTEPPPDPGRQRLRRVLDYIEANLGRDLGLAELAEVACLSPFHFSRLFARAAGVGPQRYVIQRRVERAKALLRQGETPLAAIAQELGFADQSHFTNAFRREAGVTPGRYRAANRSKTSASGFKMGGPELP